MKAFVLEGWCCMALASLSRGGKLNILGWADDLALNSTFENIEMAAILHRGREM